MKNYKLNLTKSSEGKQSFRLMKIVLLLLLTIMISSSCRHARITLDPPLPKECLVDRVSQKICEEEKRQAQSRRTASQGSKHEISHAFYWWGFTPKKIEVDTTNMCPLGVKEIHEYATWKDGLFSEVTLGIYMPRTTVVTCY
jgi:hypothetical protein